MLVIPLNKHDRYVHKLYRQIKDEYDSISTHVSFKNPKRKIAEVDIMARKGKTIDIYEVKCSHRITKAKKQLKIIKRIINADRMNFYFFCGNSSRLQEVVI